MRMAIRTCWEAVGMRHAHYCTRAPRSRSPTLGHGRCVSQYSVSACSVRSPALPGCQDRRRRQGYFWKMAVAGKIIIRDTFFTGIKLVWHYSVEI